MGPPTHEKLEIKLDQNSTSTPTTEKLVVLYPLESQEQNSVKTIINSFEENIQQQEEQDQIPLDPMTKMLMDIKRSNEENAQRISGEIAGLSRTIDENNRELNTKIVGIQNTIKTNSEEFKKEVKRIDKRLDEGEKKTISLIDKAIAEALRVNNASWENRFAKLENKEPQPGASSIQPVGNIHQQAATRVQQSEISIQEVAPRVPVSPTAPSLPEWPSVFGAQKGEKSKTDDKPLDPLEEEKLENARPEKFRNQEHEIEWEIKEHKKKIIIKVERTDFIQEFPNYSEEMTDDFLIKNPANYGKRLVAMKNKIYNATGIPPHRLDIVKMSFSITKKAKLCWLTFAKEKTVTDIFRLTQINNNMKQFNAFPHIPAKALDRKNQIEAILKRLQELDRPLRYQVRLGKSNLVIMVKHHIQYDYRKYVPVSLAVIDPNNDVPDCDLNTKSDTTENPEDQFKGQKEIAKNSPKGSLARKKKHDSFINAWQVAEFLEAYINGTATTLSYGDTNWLETEAQTEYRQTNTTYSVEEVNGHSDHNSNDDNE